MSESVKCPRCEEGTIYAREITHYYSEVIRLPDGTIDFGAPQGGDETDIDCWMCLDCGAILDWEEEKAIQQGDDD